MKLRLKVSLIAILMALMSNGLIAANFEQPYVAVQGFAEKEVKPDQLTWRLSVRNEAKTSIEVAKLHDKSVANVVKLLKKHGIDSKLIQTTHMQLSENKRYQNNQWIKEGFFASSQMAFELKDLDKYKTLWNALAEFPEVSMNGFNYSHSEEKKIRNELRAVALINAKQKATSMANVLGVKAGKPLAIEEVSSGGPVPVRGPQMMARAKLEDNSNLSPGTIEFQMTVNVTFALND